MRSSNVQTLAEAEEETDDIIRGRALRAVLVKLKLPLKRVLKLKSSVPAVFYMGYEK